MARLGATLDPPLPLGLVRSQPAVDLPGTNRQQLLLDLWADSEPLADPGHPDRQQRFQPHRPGITSRFPNRRQDGERLVTIAPTAPPCSSRSAGLLPRGRAVQKSDRIFPVVASVQAEFVQDHVFRPALRLAITLIDRSEVPPFRLVPTVPCLLPPGETYIPLRGDPKIQAH